MAGWIYRENRVPYYQRKFQSADGLRLWEKARGKYMFPAFQVLAFGTLSSSMYMMVRLLLGHKTWFGKN